MKISELAEAASVPVATVRHYLREGLLPEGRKTSRNMAYYPPGLVERIRLIKLLQEERFMPLRVIRELLDREGGDLERLRSQLDEADRGVEVALARERERSPAAEISERYSVPSEALDRLAEIGVLSPAAEGYSPSDVRIVEAISRFRAGGYDERIGFTVHDAARFLEPLGALVRSEVELLAEKVVGRFDAARSAELVEAGIDPLAELIAAMNSKLLAAALESRLRASRE
ncbi:MAG: MerR family transcriptional regulator [Solirubrobacterales bacterium]